MAILTVRCFCVVQKKKGVADAMIEACESLPGRGEIATTQDTSLLFVLLLHALFFCRDHCLLHLFPYVHVGVVLGGIIPEEAYLETFTSITNEPETG